MRKSFLSAILFGALAVASTGTFVSCSDYDDDIANLQEQVNKNAASLLQLQGDLEGELNSMKEQHSQKEAELSALINQLSAASEEVKAQLTQKIAEVAQTIAGLEARIATAENALALLQQAIDGKASTEELQQLFAQLSAVDTELAGKITSLSTALTDGLANEANARAALKADLEQQINALKAYETRIAALESSIPGIQAEVAKIQGLVESVNTLIEKADNAATDIATLKTEVQTLSGKITTALGNIDVLNVFVQKALRSLVFIPDTYYWGIEATTLKTLDYKQYPTASTIGAAENKIPYGIADMADKSEVYVYKSEDTRYTSNKKFKVMSFAAKYNLNPSTADLNEQTTTVKLVCDNKSYSTRATAQNNIVMKDWKANNGVLTVNMDIVDTTLIKYVTEDKMVSVFATQVTVDNKAASETASTATITSDWAAVYMTEVQDGFHMSLVNKAAEHATADATKAERKSPTGVVNDVDGTCSLPAKEFATAATELHLFQNPYDAVWANGGVLRDAQIEINYHDEELDLLRFVETHWSLKGGDHSVVTKAEETANNLTYEFELTGLFLGSNKTSESAHAAIKDGHILRAQMPTTDGKAAGWVNNPDQAITTVGRTPLIRVILKMGDEIVDYGYIKVKIVNKDVDPGHPEVLQYVEFTGPAWSYTEYHACNEVCKDYVYNNIKWNEVEYTLYHDKLNIDKATFDQYYTAEAPGITSALKQYIPTVSGGKITGFTAATNATELGSLIEVPNTGDAETTVFEWKIDKTVTAAKWVNNFASATTAATARKSSDMVAFKYVSNASTPQERAKYPDVYVVLKTGAITVTDNGFSSATMNLDPKKIKENWYDKNALTANTKAEARLNVYSPEDHPGLTSLAGQPFDKQLSGLFEQNLSDASIYSMMTVSDKTGTYADYAQSKLVYDLRFATENDGKKAKGQSQTTYTLLVADNGKTLKAWKTTTADAQVIATLSGTTVANTIVNYQHGTFAEDILNYCPALPTLQPDFLNVIYGIYVQSNVCGRNLPVTGNTFEARFLRPIDVKSADKDVYDAKDEAQIINLFDMVVMNDWRNYQFADHTTAPDYVTYYNVKSITVLGAAAGIDISSLVYTNLNNGSTFKPLNTVTNQVELTYNPVTPGTPAHDANYGTITYTNNSANTQDFKLSIPVRVSYEWGHIDTSVIVNVHHTAN